MRHVGRRLATAQQVVRGQAEGSWTSSQYRWSPVEDWLPEGVPVMEPGRARTEILRRWLATFGPATTADVKWWTGWTVAHARQAVRLGVRPVGDGKGGLMNGSTEDALAAQLVGEGSKKGSTRFGRLGDVMQRPPAWAGVAAVLASTGRRGRQAALRGSACYLSAALVHLPIKAVVGRRHPPGSSCHQLGPVTSSFPSGHAASDLAFTFGASQEMPVLLLPLSVATMAVHWSLVRKRAHYPSDVLAGGLLACVVALAAWKLWPPGGASPLWLGDDSLGGRDPEDDVEGADDAHSHHQSA